MKFRIICILLTLALLLGSCSAGPWGPTGPDTQAWVTLPPESGAAGTSEPSTAGTQPPSEPTASTEPVDSTEGTVPSLPPETSAPTLPPETMAPTLPPTTAAPTAPEITVSTAPTQTKPPAPPVSEPLISCSYAFVYDCSSQKLLYTRGAQDAQIAPASLTKLFTCHVALQYLQPEAVVTVGPEITWIAFDSSVVGLKQGQQLTVEQLIASMILRSGNDSAYTLAVAAGRAAAEDPSLTAREALECFIAEMNNRAAFYGMKNTHIVNPDGYTAEGHYISPGDMLTIARLVLNDPLVTTYAAMERFTGKLVSGEAFDWGSTNALIRSESEFYSPNACGLKTGFTEAAGYCLVAAFHYDGGMLLVGIMDAESAEDRCKDALALYNYFTQVS